MNTAPSSWDLPIEHSNIPALCHRILSGLSTLINQVTLLNKVAEDIVEWCVNDVALYPSLLSGFHQIASRSSLH